METVQGHRLIQDLKVIIQFLKSQFKNKDSNYEVNKSMAFIVKFQQKVLQFTSFCYIFLISLRWSWLHSFAQLIQLCI